ncbi:hypothetical protein OAN52_01820 [Amylibacter sp.]|jgi:hypothetical protein|nr:hypothetical protein [Amylibacter sp.]MDA9269831.1 hypothetical protein [Amylibacter sp.]MDA9278117.1 hypothetical protein [Amylibacter sp.]MDA9534526.1 hypothetical protein [Amylibacter sp.]MDA9894796.1 hypothetical protein [Amylibacter sp.]|tara:strand:- start:1180 stop:1404 length:225 start_codon:yes stop_codon:yes gene_type:complete
MNTNEKKMQQELLNSKLGISGSGYARYGAAMYFYNQGILTEAMLEIYRRCCKFDNEDPIDLAEFEKVPNLKIKL